MVVSRGGGLPWAAVAAVVSFAWGSFAHAQTPVASDFASSYSSWTNGSNQSTNLGAWDLTNNNNDPDGDPNRFAGYFLGDSTAGAGDINTAGQSFGVYAHPGGTFADASLDLNSQLTSGRTLTFDMAVNFDNGAKGFSLIESGSGNEILNWNLGGGAATNSNFTKNETTAQYDYGGGDAVLNVSMTLDSASSLSYLINRTSSLGFQGTLFEGTISGITSLPSSLKFYVSGTDNGDAANNIYFNSIEVSPVPEPGSLSLAFLATAIPAVASFRWFSSRQQRRD